MLVDSRLLSPPSAPPRQITMIVAACWFLARAGLNAGAHELWMLVVGRIFLGFEIGMANQVSLSAGEAWLLGLSLRFAGRAVMGGLS